MFCFRAVLIPWHSGLSITLPVCHYATLPGAATARIWLPSGSALLAPLRGKSTSDKWTAQWKR